MHFGEMALIERKPQLRGTSIRALTDVVLAVLTAKDFDLICAHFPQFKETMNDVFVQRQKDSLSKGVKISFERQNDIQS